MLATGWENSCALVHGGAVECWGADRYRQLGNGVTQPSSLPTSVHGLVGAVAVAVGGYVACAELTAAVECWGIGTEGQLGDGTYTSSSIPVAVKGVGSVKDLSVGFAHAV
jgi:alpha-tubulin suppressor-like RCC1 family protein